MHNLEKPIIGSLNGFIKNFGFQLAVMCDLTVLDETSLISFSEANIKSKTPDVVYQRLVSKVGISKAAEIVLMNIAWSPESAKDCGLTNRIVKCGSGKVIKYTLRVQCFSYTLSLVFRSYLFYFFNNCCC